MSISPILAMYTLYSSEFESKVIPYSLLASRYTNDGKVNLVADKESKEPLASKILTSSGSNVTSPNGGIIWVGTPFLKVLIWQVIGIDSDFVLK